MMQAEQSLMLEGPAGAIEAILTQPSEDLGRYFALLGHPHSLMGGTMHNKVVTTLARVFRDLGIPSLRFNFRGVGGSAGNFDQGIAESEDMIALWQQFSSKFPNRLPIFAGFSFGSYVSYRAAAQLEAALLVSIAPPVPRFNYLEYKPSCPWIIVQGMQDEVVAAEEVLAFAEQLDPKPELICFEAAGHFFHGALMELRDALSLRIGEQLPR